MKKNKALRLKTNIKAGQDCKKVRKKAWRAGYEKGRAAGYSDGYAKGLKLCKW